MIDVIKSSIGLKKAQVDVMERLLNERRIESKSAFIRESIDEHLKKYGECP